MNHQVLGHSATGEEAVLLTIKNKQRLQVTLSNFGARLVSILCPDKEGNLADVCLGFDTLADYETCSGYLGATIGRYGNRIGGATFALDGVSYPLYANDGENTLHGGQSGFDQKFWDYEVLSENSVRFSYTSKDMEEGFPGTLETKVIFTVLDDGSLVIDYHAKSDKDTVINLTNHAYFNLAGEGTIHDHLLSIQADLVTSADENLIPDGSFLAVKSTPYDLLSPKRLGDVLAQTGQNPMFDAASGFDINYVLLGLGLKEAAKLSHPQSGRVMSVWTDQPGIQVYSGQGLSGPAKNGAQYGAYSGIALETQHFPDSVHQSHFPSTVLKKGEEWTSRTVYRFTVE